MIQAIIFDCFGVLVGRGFKETYRIAGGDPVRDARFVEDLLGQTNMGFISDAEFDRQMAAKLSISVDDYKVAVKKSEQPNTELLQYIANLHKTYKTAILSNANKDTLRYTFADGQLDGLFDDIIVSAEVGMVKPDPDIFTLAADRLAVDPQKCVFIDDQDRYCQGARDIGMQAIVYKNFDQFTSDLEDILK